MRCLRGRAWARAKASRTTRSTPNRVLTLTSVAISFGVPVRSDAAVADVRTLGALADDDEVDAVRGDPLDGQRALHPGVELGRAQVDVLLQGEAQRQQHAALEDAARHGRVADRAEQDRVVAAQLLEDRVGQRLAGGVPAPGAEVVLGRVELGAGAGGDRLEDLEALGDDLRADPVAADDGEVDGVVAGALGSHVLQPKDGLAI